MNDKEIKKSFIFTIAVDDSDFIEISALQTGTELRFHWDHRPMLIESLKMLRRKSSLSELPCYEPSLFLSSPTDFWKRHQAKLEKNKGEGDVPITESKETTDATTPQEDQSQHKETADGKDNPVES